MKNRANWLVVGGAALVLAALVFTIVVVLRDDEEAANGTTTTAVSTTTTGSTTTSTSTTTTVPPSPEDEIRRSAADLLEVRDDVLMNPDTARISEYAEDQSPLYAIDRDSISRLVAANARWGGDPARVLGVRLDANEGGSPRVSVVIEADQVNVVDANGTVLQQLPAGRQAYSMSLLGAPGTWRINDFFVLDQLVPSAVEDIISRGVP